MFNVWCRSVFQSFSLKIRIVTQRSSQRYIYMYITWSLFYYFKRKEKVNKSKIFGIRTAKLKRKDNAGACELRNKSFLFFSPRLFSITGKGGRADNTKSLYNNNIVDILNIQIIRNSRNCFISRQMDINFSYRLQYKY